jgi:hypothetical protein
VFNAVVSNSRQALIQDKILPTGHALLAKWGLSRNHLNDREQKALDEAVAKRKVSGRGFVADVSQRVPQQCCSAIVNIHLQRPTK